MPTVFVCYRREDSARHARRLRDDLVRLLGQDSVFIDIEAIAPGMDFKDAIRAMLDRVDMMLVVIGPGWLEGTDGSRLNSPDDHVRREIASALMRQIPVVPVLVGGGRMPTRSQLPDDLKELTGRQAIELTHTLAYDTERRLNSLKTQLVLACDPVLQDESPWVRAPNAAPSRAGGSWLGTPVTVIRGVANAGIAVVGLAYSGVSGSIRATASAAKRLRPRKPAPHLPTNVVVDDVHFTLTSPAQLRPGTSAEIIFWCHLDRDRPTVLQRAAQALRLRRREVAVKSEGPFEVARGAVLTVVLSIEGLHVEPPAKTVLWKGRTGNATFVATTPAECPLTEHTGTASVRVEGSEIARLDFVLAVADKRSMRRREHRSVARHSTAFASYASEDRAEVMKRVQGIKKAAPKLDIFVDIIKLRSGQYWEDEIRDRIPRSDIFYLFWSRRAKASEWVDKEWRLAYQQKGLDFIDPVALESAAIAPPPPELAKKHFDDPLMVYIAQGRSSAS